MATIAALPQSRAVAVARQPCFASASAPAQVPAGAVANVTISPGANDESVVSLTAAAPIFASYAVMYVGSGGCVHADPTSASYVFAGIATQSGAQGAIIAVRRRDAFAFSTWAWTPGESVFALPGGVLTQAAPAAGVLHQIGIALDAVTLLIEPADPVYL